MPNNSFRPESKRINFRITNISIDFGACFINLLKNNGLEYAAATIERG